MNDALTNANDNRSSVARGDLLLDHGACSGVRGAGSARPRTLLFSSAGRTPWWGTSFARPLSSPIGSRASTRRAGASSRANDARTKRSWEQSSPSRSRMNTGTKRRGRKRPDLSAFGSLLMFSGYQHGPSEYTHSHQYAAYYAQREALTIYGRRVALSGRRYIQSRRRPRPARSACGGQKESKLNPSGLRWPPTCSTR